MSHARSTDRQREMEPAPRDAFERLPAGSRVLVALADRLGDTLFRTPALAVLAAGRPDLRFEALVFGEAASGVLEGNPHVAAVHISKDPRAIASLARHFALVINLRRVNARRYLGRADVPMLAFAHAKREGHKCEELTAFARGLLGERARAITTPSYYQLFPDARHEARVDALLAGWLQQLPGEPRLVGLHLGCGGIERLGFAYLVQSRHTHHKAWPLPRYLELARAWRSRDPSVRFVLLGARNERFLARRLLRALPDALDITGRTSVCELAALLRRLRVLICPDSGPMHIACAVGTPLVGLFGATKPWRTGPFPADPRFRVLRAPRVRDIAASDVLAAALELAEGARTPGAPLLHAPPPAPDGGREPTHRRESPGRDPFSAQSSAGSGSSPSCLRSRR